MIEEISAALAAADPTVRKRLKRCIPALTHVLDDWSSNAAAGELTVALATRHNALILTAPCWPDQDAQAAAKIERGDAAMALADAAENSDRDSGGTILIAASVLLGEQALAAHAADVARITQGGRRALTVLLIDRNDRNIAVVCTTVEMPLGMTLH